MHAQQLHYRFRRDLNMAIGPVFAGQIVRQVTTWVNKSGTEWTCTRLKALWTAALQLRAGNLNKVRQIYQDNSIAYKRGTNIPCGPYGPIVRQFQEAQEFSVLKRYALALRGYTLLKLDEVSEIQYTKAKASITTPYQGDEAMLRSVSKTLNGLASAYRELVKLPNPNLKRLKPYSSYPCQGIKMSGQPELAKLPYGRALVSLWTDLNIPKHLRRDNPVGDLWEMSLTRMLDEDIDNYLVDVDLNIGNINFLQEPGCKARVVASPGAMTQFLMEPLHVALDKLVKVFPESCVHDQNKGAYFLSNAISQFKTVSCFDLSSATDRFPLSLQTSVLEGLGLSNYARSLEEACRDWHVNLLSVGKKKLPPTTWTYACGQPMGLYGSFPLFHLTHVLMLKALERDLAIPPGNFLVLGDDVIITHPVLSQCYRTTLESLDIPVSPSKTLESSVVGEFAGFIGVKTNKSVLICRPYKFSGSVIRNPFELIHALGSRVRKLGTLWSRTFDKYAAARDWFYPDLSPIIGDLDDPGHMDPVINVIRLESYIQRVNSIASISLNDIWWVDNPDMLVAHNLLDMEVSELFDPDPFSRSRPEVERPLSPPSPANNREMTENEFVSDLSDRLTDVLEDIPHGWNNRDISTDPLADVFTRSSVFED